MQPHFTSRRTTLALALLCVCSTAGTGLMAAGAANGSTHPPEPAEERIVVTADWRQARLDQITASVAVIDADAIAARGGQHLEQVLALVPNLNFAQGSARARYFQIRGIGERSQFAEPLNASVGLLIDGVDFSGVGGAATLFDVEQVEVLRGPQGTRYGANALAGLINVLTHAPSVEPEVRVQSELSNYNSFGLGAAAGGPLAGETWLYRMAVHAYRSDGFIDNDAGSGDTNNFDERSWRGRLRYVPSDTLTVDAGAGFIDIDNGYDAFSLDNDRHTRSDQPGKDRQRSRFFNVRADWQLDPAATLQGQVAVEHSNLDYGYDEDWTFVGFHPDEYSSTDNYRRDRHMQSAELRLQSNPDGRFFGATTDWLVGVYGIHENVDLTRTYTFFAAPFASEFSTERVALFAQSDTALNEQWAITLGGRYEHRAANYDDSEAVGFSPDEHLWGAHVTLTFDVNPQLRTYGTLARGYKAGGFNTDGTLSAALRRFDNEKVMNAELGAKGNLLDGAAHYRVALFRMLRDDVQIATSFTRPVTDDPQGPVEFIDFIGNAAEGVNQGAEVELTVDLAEGLRWYGSFGLLDTEYRRFINAVGDNLDGREQAQAPNYQFAMGVQWRIATQWWLEADIEGKDGFYFDDANSARSDPYQLLHARLRYEGAGWNATLFARNVFDKDVEVRGFVFGNDPRDGYAPHVYTQLGEPRRVGLTVAAEF